MSYASGTTHYNLPQTVGSDKRDWTDTNQAFSDIDAAIYSAVQGASAATSAIETINGEIETITGKQAVDEGNISTLAGKVSTLESTVGTQGAAIADVRQDLQDNIESNHEASATSTHAYNIGDTFYYNDVLYKATAPIAIGGTIVPSTNCTAVTVMSEIDDVNSEISELNSKQIRFKIVYPATTWSYIIADIYTYIVAAMGGSITQTTQFAIDVAGLGSFFGYLYNGGYHVSLAYDIQSDRIKFTSLDFTTTGNVSYGRNISVLTAGTVSYDDFTASSTSDGLTVHGTIFVSAE